MIKKVRASVIGIAAMAVVLAAVLVTGGVMLTGREQNAMPTDGYVLGVSQEEEGASVYQQNFAAGTVIGKKFPSSYAYQDVEGDKTVVADDSFLHFSDGSHQRFHGRRSGGRSRSQRQRRRILQPESADGDDRGQQRIQY